MCWLILSKRSWLQGTEKPAQMGFLRNSSPWLTSLRSSEQCHHGQQGHGNLVLPTPLGWPHSWAGCPQATDPSSQQLICSLIQISPSCPSKVLKHSHALTGSQVHL